MIWILSLAWLVSFAICMLLEWSKISNIRKNSGPVMLILFVISGLWLAPILLLQIFVSRLFARITIIEDEKALNRLR